jgi:NAD(P)-dependent dehydrogenase (short-subunit alcohol dehydrogenase family)
MDWREAVDALLELSVVGSFSSIGSTVRRRLFGWADPAPGALDGRTVVITGPTSGLGRAAADELARLGARLVLVGRSQERLTTVQDELTRRHGADRFATVVADMGSLTAVRSAVETILGTESRLDVLIDNAGAIFPKREIGPDGIERTLATLVVGPFALIAGLRPLLGETPGARVLAVTSGGQYAQRLPLDDLEFERGTYDGTRAYARAKRAQVTLMREWARLLEPDGIAVMSMHPGWADTQGLAEALPGFHRLLHPILRTPAAGIDTLVWLATVPGPLDLSGRLFLDRRPRPFDRAPWTRLSAEDRRDLVEQIAHLAGVDLAGDPKRRDRSGSPGPA